MPRNIFNDACYCLVFTVHFQSCSDVPMRKKLKMFLFCMTYVICSNNVAFISFKPHFRSSLLVPMCGLSLEDIVNFVSYIKSWKLNTQWYVTSRFYASIQCNKLYNRFRRFAGAKEQMAMVIKSRIVTYYHLYSFYVCLNHR